MSNEQKREIKMSKIIAELNNERHSTKTYQWGFLLPLGVVAACLAGAFYLAYLALEFLANII